MDAMKCKMLTKWSLLQVNEAAKVLHEYNNRLSAEMEDRKKLTTMLKDFQAEQRDLMAQAEQRLQVILTTVSSLFPSFLQYFICVANSVIHAVSAL